MAINLCDAFVVTMVFDINRSTRLLVVIVVRIASCSVGRIGIASVVVGLHSAIAVTKINHR